jgi:indole-3-glycerol phosphate synthase
MAANILETIIKTKRKEVADLHERFSLDELRAKAKQAPPALNFFAAVTRKPRRMVNLIAEVKKASPSAGVIREDFDPVTIARDYERAGANALSVLTDQQYFQGSLDYLTAIRAAVKLPLLRKDFIIDPYQVYETRAAGADAILLIAAALPAGRLLDLMILAAELRLTSLVEVHNADELLAVRSAIGFPHRAYSLLGINNRDLTTFEVDIATTIRLSELVPDGVPLVSESGIGDAADVQKLASAGVQAILVGETLMRSKDVTSAVESLVGPPRQSGKGHGTA